MLRLSRDDVVVGVECDPDAARVLTPLINAAYSVGEKGIFIGTEERPFTRVIEEEVRELISAGHFLTVRTLDRTTILGCVKTCPDIDEGSIGEWGCLAVADGQLNRGLGSMLVTAAESRLRAAKCCTAQLELLSPIHWRHEHKERLREWYTKIGYKLKVPGDFSSSTVQFKEGTRLMDNERFVLACDANLTAYRRPLT
jgi:GNAT superfamily N-acetyltransferase